MAVHSKVIRQFLIISLLRRPGYPSLERIVEILIENRHEQTTRTVQRDIESIRKELGIVIRYSSFHMGYYIDREASLDMEPLMKFLEMAIMSGTIKDLQSEPEEVKKLVSFDSSDEVKGMEYFSNILYALRHSQELEIDYKRFADQASFPVIVRPGLLKEYQNRWYVIGVVPDHGQVRAFSLDRVKDLKLRADHFDPAVCEGIRERFDYVIGISGSDKKPMLIRLVFTPDQAPYIETLPWHPTQEVESRDKKEVVFSLYVVPNYELIQKILAEGKHVLRIEPEELRLMVEERK